MRPTLAILADAPESGVVLPRVAAEIGTAHATRLYRVLLARAIAAARGAGFRWTVWFRPADAGPMLRRWLGEETDLRPQASGTIGARAAAAVAGSNLPAGWMVLLRPVSGIEAALLRHAALLLVDSPIVPHRRSIVAPGPGALAWLRRALDDAGIPVAELPVRRTITSAADARAARLLA